MSNDLIADLMAEPSNGKTSAQRIAELEDLIPYHRNLYEAGTPEILDSQFDELEAELRRLDSSNAVLEEVGGHIDAPHLTKVQHKVEMGSLRKAMNPAEVVAWWTAKRQEVLKETGVDIEVDGVVIADKLDGISLYIEYFDGKLVQAVTRGKENIGEDITQNVMKMKVPKTIPLKGTVRVRAEVLMRDSTFLAHIVPKLQREGKEITNARNVASGAARSKDGTNCELLEVIAYRLWIVG